MKRHEDELIDPEVAAELQAVDATLAGEAVDPEHAELAELALLIAAARPSIETAFAAELDERVGRFAQPASRRRRQWFSLPMVGGALASCAALAVAVVIVVGMGSSGHRATSKLFPDVAAKRPAARSLSAASSGAIATPSSGKSAFSGILAPANGAASASAGAGAPAPQPNGRKVVQSAELALTTSPAHVDDVAQELFNVVGSERGIVGSSSVTATGGPDGYAHFSLSIPSANVTDTMTRLSQLRYASVASRTDTTRDINGSYVSAGRRLADAQALRTALLKQLAAATTSAQVASLQGRIRDADAQISKWQSQLSYLNHQVNFSQVTVNVSAGPITPVPVHHQAAGGFTLTRALHDAGRVLTVAAGVAVITLAVLVPVSLVGGLAWWAAAAVRRRRREQALDLA